MKKFVLHIGIAAIFSLGITAGCSKHSPCIPDLLSAEILMQDRPDSTYFILQNIDTTILISPADKALYALLYTQAQDKNYIDSEDESLILEAVNYYEDGKDTYHKMLSYYYLARIQENRREYSNAIISLLKAENSANIINDYFELGLIYRSFSDIYGRVYNSVEGLNFARKSYCCFLKSGRTNYSNWGLLDVGKAFHNCSEYDSSLVIANKLYNTAATDKDSLLMSDCLRLMATSFLAKEDYFDAINSYRRLQNLGAECMTYEDCLNLGISYFNSGNLDSARFYANILKSGDSPHNWLSYLIYKQTGNYQDALTILEKEDEHGNQIIREIINQDITYSVSNYRNNETLVHENELLLAKRSRTISIIILISLIVIVSLTLILHIKSQNIEIEKNLLTALSLRDMLNSRETEAKAMQNILSQNKAETENLRQAINSIFEQNFTTIDKLSSTYYECQGTSNERNRIYSDVMNLVTSLGSDKKTLKKLEGFVNQYKDNLMSRFRATFPDMKESDYILYLYTVAGFSPRAISTFINEKLEVVYNRKSRLKQKINRELSSDNEFVGYL